MKWSLHNAKNRFSEVVDKSVREGPQIITRRGNDTAVVVSTETYRAWSGKQGRLVEFFKDSPLRGEELHLERDQDPGRPVDL